VEVQPSIGARLVRSLLLLLCLLGAWGATPATAAPPTPLNDEPRFFLEKITVAGHRRPAAARIVVSTSLLVADRSYSEDDLRIAIRRIKRLPFVLDADFSLQKGSERGRYELVIRIEETRPLFANLDVVGDLAEHPVLSTRETSSRVDFSDKSVLGVREFVGSEGLVFATVGSPNGLVQAGYTRYDLFGRGSFASLALAYNPETRTFTPSFLAGVPLTVNQSLRTSLSWSRSRTRRDDFQDASSQQSGQLDWLYNTTDDPFFPTRGDEVQASLLYQRFHAETRFTAAGLPPFRLDDRTWGFSLSGLHHLPLTARQSLAFGLAAAGYRSRQDTSQPLLGGADPAEDYQAVATLTHAFDLWQGGRAHRFGDLRLETTATYSGIYTDALRNVLPDLRHQYQLTVGETLTFRNPWAVVRFGLRYDGKVTR
jgi:hypothetical protein